MKVILALVFLGLIAISSATHTVKKAHPFVMDTGFLHENRARKRTSSFADITAFFQQFNFRDSSGVHTFIQGLRDRLVSERTEQLSILEQSRSECSTESDFRTAAIAEGNEAAAKSVSQLNLCSSEKDEATNLGNLAAAALVIYENDLENLEAARTSEIDVYNTRRARLVEVQNAIDKTLEFVNELEAQTGGLRTEFVQMTNRLLQSTVRTGHSHMVLPIYTKLLQMHATQDFGQEAIGQVKSLLSTLRENSLNSVSALDTEEANNLQRYNDNHARLDGLISKLSNQVAASNNYVTSMQSCIDQETSIHALAEDKVTRNTELLESARTLCQATEDEFTHAELARTTQQNLLNSLEAGLAKVESAFEAGNTEKVGDIISLKLL